MAAAYFIACFAPPGHVMLNSLKDARHFPDGSSCYCNSCHKIMLSPLEPRAPGFVCTPEKETQWS
jgi:hypothetical protein